MKLWQHACKSIGRTRSTRIKSIRYNVLWQIANKNQIARKSKKFWRTSSRSLSTSRKTSKSCNQMELWRLAHTQTAMESSRSRKAYSESWIISWNVQNASSTSARVVGWNGIQIRVAWKHVKQKDSNGTWSVTVMLGKQIDVQSASHPSKRLTDVNIWLVLYANTSGAGCADSRTIRCGTTGKAWVWCAKWSVAFPSVSGADAVKTFNCFFSSYSCPLYCSSFA